MLAKRLVTGLCFIIALVGLLWLDAWLGPVKVGNWSFPPGLILAGVGAVLVGLGSCELTRIAAVAGLQTDALLTASASVAVMLATWLSASMPVDFDSTVPLSIIVLALVASIIRFSHGRKVDHAFAASSVVMLSVVYLGVLSGFLLLIGAEISIWMIGGVALVVKCCDIGAFFTGRAIGRHKLIPWLSPGKTIEGLVGGILASMIAAIVLNALLGSPLAWWWVLIMGGVLAVVGQAGDLTMSLFKRGAGFKDSSSLLPGLGGVMDVIDSLLLAAPVAWWMLRLSLGSPG
ncbi:MAG: phosphatidate cytidylyltransferase [Planctomycetota bacterium]|nr:phosphatidate cytidylyltransferase [Planctomycetota bacterium]